MDKCFFFYRPKMAKVLRETVARQLEKKLNVLKDEQFRARAKYADDYEKPAEKKVDLRADEGVDHWREERI